MLNQIFLVGRIITDINESDSSITLAVQRSYKNTEGVYDTDFIKCIIWDNIAKSVFEYCKKGDIVGVKGRVQSNDDKIEIVAEKITFLSSEH